MHLAAGLQTYEDPSPIRSDLYTPDFNFFQSQKRHFWHQTDLPRTFSSNKFFKFSSRVQTSDADPKLRLKTKHNHLGPSWRGQNCNCGFRLLHMMEFSRLSFYFPFNSKDKTVSSLQKHRFKQQKHRIRWFSLWAEISVFILVPGQIHRIPTYVLIAMSHFLSSQHLPHLPEHCIEILTSRFINVPDIPFFIFHVKTTVRTTAP